MCDQQSLKSAYAQSDQSLCSSLEYSLSVKLLTEHHLEILSLSGGCTGSSESTFVKMPHCWTPDAQITFFFQNTENEVCCAYSQQLPAAKIKHFPENKKQRYVMTSSLRQ